MIELNAKQITIVKLIAKSYTRRDIASELGVSMNSIGKHRDRINKKLGFSDTAALTRYALRLGLIEA